MTPLQIRCYELLRTVPKGQVTTYKALALALGTTGYRAIGQFMRTNPDAPRTPCHRVVGSDGGLHGYMGKTKGESLAKKAKLLHEEGVEIENGKVKNFQKILYLFPTS